MGTDVLFSDRQHGSTARDNRPQMIDNQKLANTVQLTDYHAKYFAYELTKRCASDSVQKLTASLADAQVDLNPHQVEAALFAFRSPLSKGAILADEVGLGKTIEAGLLISQKWAEKKRKVLLIVPSSLRKQWNAELQEKFFIRKGKSSRSSYSLKIFLSLLNLNQRLSSLKQKVLRPREG